MTVELRVVRREGQLEIEPSRNPGFVDDGPVQHNLLHHLGELPDGRISGGKQQPARPGNELQTRWQWIITVALREVLWPILPDGKNVRGDIPILMVEDQFEAIG